MLRGWLGRGGHGGGGVPRLRQQQLTTMASWLMLAARRVRPEVPTPTSTTSTTATMITMARSLAARILTRFALFVNPSAIQCPSVDSSISRANTISNPFALFHRCQEDSLMRNVNVAVFMTLLCVHYFLNFMCSQNNVLLHELPSPSLAPRWGTGTPHCFGREPWGECKCAPSAFANTLQLH